MKVLTVEGRRGTGRSSAAADQALRFLASEGGLVVWVTDRVDQAVIVRDDFAYLALDRGLSVDRLSGRVGVAGGEVMFESAGRVDGRIRGRAPGMVVLDPATAEMDGWLERLDPRLSESLRVVRVVDEPPAGTPVEQLEWVLGPELADMHEAEVVAVARHLANELLVRAGRPARQLSAAAPFPQLTEEARA